MKNNEYLPQAPGDLAQARRQHAPAARAVDDSLRLPPHSVEAEQGVLGCIFLLPQECLATCVERLRGGALCFYDLRHQTIYSCLAQMYDRREAIDVITVQQRLKDAGTLEQVGGIAYLATLPDTVPSAANLEFYLNIVREKYLLRRMVTRFTAAIRSIYEWQGDVEPLLTQIEGDISQLTEQETVASEEHIKTVLHRVVDDMEKRHYDRGRTQLRGLALGAEGNYIDKVVQGIRPTHYVVLAGRPGSGKTSYAMNLVEFWTCEYVWWQPLTAEEAAALEARGEPVTKHEEDGRPATYHLRRVGVPVTVFSIEMDADSLVERMLFARAGIDTAQYAQGYAEGGGDAVVRKLAVASGKLGAAPIYIVSEPGQNISKMAAQARRMVKQYGLKEVPSHVPRMIFVLDYIQLATTDQERDDARQRVGKISKKIMALKKQLRCPWIVLAQMNRNIETGERERKPVLSDLKESGDLEQDADVVMFTHKSTMKELEKSGDAEVINAWALQKKVPWSRVPYRVDMVIPKNRYGPTGEAQFVFQKNLCRFEDKHLWFAQHGLEELKAGEREKVVRPEQREVDYGGEG